jgi:heme-degrading monooxygenase HmoA
MITEIAQIDVKPGTEKDFEAAVAKARPLFLRAKGGKGFELHKSIEKPSRYRLMAKWKRWKITPWISAAPKILPHGARWSGSILPHPLRSSTLRQS